MAECCTYNMQLLHAVQEKDFEKFKHLISDHSKGVLTSWINICHEKSGDTILHIAARCGFIEVLKLVKDTTDFERSNFDGKCPLHEAAQYGQLECLQFMLSLGVKVDCLKRADWTPLMLACTKNDKVIIQNLIEADADPKLRNKDGWNAFHIACREGHADIIDYLLDVDHSLWNSVSNNGRTPLHTAALHGKFNVVAMLLSRGSYSVDEKDSCGSTPLMDAARNGHTNITNLLISKHQADVNAKDILGRNALHLAAQAGSLESIKHLIKNCGMDPNSLTTDHQTPLHLAAKEGQKDAIILLLQSGTQQNTEDRKGRKAFDIAKGARHNECCQILKEEIQH